MHQTRGADFYASLRTQTALEKAEVAVVLVDAESIAEQDVRIIQHVIDAGRALVIAYNKWDLIDEERRHYLEREIDSTAARIWYGPGSLAAVLTVTTMPRSVMRRKFSSVSASGTSRRQPSSTLPLSPMAINST